MCVVVFVFTCGEQIVSDFFSCVDFALHFNESLKLHIFPSCFAILTTALPYIMPPPSFYHHYYKTAKLPNLK